MRSYLKSIGTAVPQFKNVQQDIAHFMAEAAGMTQEEKNVMTTLYRASGIGNRHSVIPDFGRKNGAYTFFPNTPNLEPFPTVRDRMQLYEREALPLALKAVGNCFEAFENFKPKSITHLITVSCSGMYAPGLDIELVEKLSLNRSVQRTSINFMGCYAAFNGLKIADAICKSNSEAKVLLVCVELCTIHYQKSKDWDQVLSNALFSDGAAAVLIDNEKPVSEKALMLDAFHCDLAPEGKNDMAWHIGDFGFEMILSSYIPNLIKSGIAKLTSDLLKNLELEPEEIDFYAIHPGGKKILEVIESELKIEKSKNRYAHQVLREYGNMSSPTVLFVLKEIMKEVKSADHEKNILSFAFGPGLTMESMLLKVYSENVSVNSLSIAESETVSIS
ncbi:MAG TPA: type III polyketide synthase [Cytophagaceae bacterium]|jgi:alpha-pyrone synthase|nr:type III polyketide synthase [Cytophagaceae bacterium]